jgi:S-adenosylmethionine synthetase
MEGGIFVEPVVASPTSGRRFEVVERKGVGHPDTICDLVMNEISVELSQLYMRELGFVQHHNLDKALLAAGQSENRFGGGKVLKPMKLILGDRATFGSNGHVFPVEEVATQTALSWFEKNLRFVKEENIEFQFEIGTAAGELRSIFAKHGQGTKMMMAANDTSALVGYAPATKTETAVLQTERYVNSARFKSEFPESGEDVKVMAFRNGDVLELTVAIAFVDRHVNSEKHYFQRKREMLQAISEFHKREGFFGNVGITINNLDREGAGIEGIYLTVLGTSADSSDSGQVGRGNRVNQVISLMRPSGSEAAAGKNPVSHIGKIYNVMCFNLADEIYKNVGGEIEEVFVWMYNTIGHMVDSPKAVVVQPVVGTSRNGRVSSSTEKEIIRVVRDNLARMNDLCNDLASGKIRLA